MNNLLLMNKSLGVICPFYTSRLRSHYGTHTTPPGEPLVDICYPLYKLYVSLSSVQFRQPAWTDMLVWAHKHRYTNMYSNTYWYKNINSKYHPCNHCFNIHLLWLHPIVCSFLLAARHQHQERTQYAGNQIIHISCLKWE